MKKFVLCCFAICFLFGNAMAQEETGKSKPSESRALAFMESSGTFVKKEFYPLSTISRVKYDVLILTNLLNNKKIGCLRMTITYSSSYSTDEYVGTLDFDEIDACVQCLSKLQNEILPTQASVYTELTYKSRDGVEVGAFYSEKKQQWEAYICTKGYTMRSAEYFNSESIPEIIANMQQAKTLITEHTK